MDGKQFEKELLDRLKRNDKVVQYAIGFAYYHGWSFDRNNDEAFKWLTRSAEQGYAEAQYQLGGMHLNGYGVPENEVEAEKWILLAAEQGHTRAQRFLGDLYDNRKDYTNALKWYQLAADQGERFAACNAGEMYYKGLGTTRDIRKAREYFVMSGFRDTAGYIAAIDKEIRMENRTKVFICHSSKDHDRVDELKTHLEGLRHSQISVEYWDDSMIKPGSKWQDEIQRALETALVAMLMVSGDFLASEFIRENELPQLIKDSGEDEIVVLPVAVTHSNYKHTPLNDYQFVGDPGRPLSEMTDRNERDKLYLLVSNSIMEIFTSPKQ